jgi:hypothetical protein
MPDKRNYARFRISGTVSIKAGNGESDIFNGDLIDFSFQGIAVDLDRKLEMPVGTIVDFELTLEVWRMPLIAKGKIANIVEGRGYGNRSCRVGIEFIDADQDTISLLINRTRRKIAEIKRKKAAAKGAEIKDYVF